MATNVASKDSPMTLARREELQQHQISFHVPPHEIVFNTNAGELMTEQQLCHFVDNILSKLANEFPSVEGPRPGAWNLSTKDVEEDLRTWDPHKLAPGALIAIKSKLESYRPVITGSLAAEERSWEWARGMRTFELPCQEAFLFELDSHVLLTLRCQTKVKVVGKAKKIIRETKHSILVPNSHAVSDVLALIRAKNVHGVYQEPDEENLRLDRRPAQDLGWTNSTTLKLELW
ncbi:hypothetical protein DL98DRAFT_510711 [Cadophora sp. DSE1049]|nr:hypothetical protein DL98DRAFT_510711 [Cadophora sp. DSE1049]